VQKLVTEPAADLCRWTSSDIREFWKAKHMSWAKYAIEALQRGEVTMIRPRGHSMKGKVNDGDLVTIAPCDPAALHRIGCQGCGCRLDYGAWVCR